MVATCNTLNLANAGRPYYPNQAAYGAAEYERKIDWLGERFRALNADVLAVQEVWDEAAFKAALGRSRLHYHSVSVPGAENGPGGGGALGTPRVGMAARVDVERLQGAVERQIGRAGRAAIRRQGDAEGEGLAAEPQHQPDLHRRAGEEDAVQREILGHAGGLRRERLPATIADAALIGKAVARTPARAAPSPARRRRSGW